MKQPTLKITLGKNNRFYYFSNGIRITEKRYEELFNKWTRKFWTNCYSKLNLDQKHVDNIMDSVYKYQANDYHLLKLPGDELEYAPADHKLTSIIRKLWENNIVTLGWNQGEEDDTGFISIKKKTLEGKDALKVLKRLFGSMIYVSKKWVPTKLGLIKVVLREREWYSLVFRFETIDKIHQQLNIEEEKDKPLPGLYTCIKTLGYNPPWWD